MSDVDRHLLVCDPLPHGSSKISGWKKAIHGVQRIILEKEQPSHWELAEIIANIPVNCCLGSDSFSVNSVKVVSKVLPDFSEYDGLVGSVCAMSAVINSLANCRLSVRHKILRRDSIALALWSALSFQKPLAEQRLEDIRADILRVARRTSLDLIRRTRVRHNVPNDQSADSTSLSLQWKSVLDQEEIEVLRWILADNSSLLERPYADIENSETLAVAQGLELGQILTKFPAFEHYELASRGLVPTKEIDLDALLDAVGEHRESLVAPFEGNKVVERCPTVFPLLTALKGGQYVHDDGRVARSIADWCGRALIESAIAKRAK